MLPKELWKPWEPRGVFPVFADAENILDFVVQDSLRLSVRALGGVVYAALKKQKPLSIASHDVASALLRRGLSFRAAYLTRDGRFVREWRVSEALRAGGFFSVSINKLLERDGRQLADGLVILIASRGRVDRWSSSPGSATVRYVGKSYIAGFRTGLFARALNPVHDSRHRGFTGINPQVLVTEDVEASVLLMNHSSDPEYDRAVRPTIRLYRDPATYLEAAFAEIPPHGARECSVSELFPDARRFLAPTRGKGLTIAKAQGVTLASVHLLRSRSGTTFGLDHSRPAYANVVD
jgi:hypothetical protein